ncbi:DNA mismatch repair endonuclease MutL [Lacticaseibacillus casei]|jgi:DNA mismatch repair protein MutL|uniref:DNA mismatch repair protein MutL n=1 Tax=Lacticaseibacillus huelsenbergensis TaxID=3035291 RepID=A0ABY8DUH1_9LACO|nr:MULTISPECIES: DNA mismatch repair endonuclease MutL [Lacticaseibacillus]MDG3061075.1 DNA mismatch repair endonuclease MutL [Lacticaseibacillus sp. BCRC 81376]QVI37156.1 DNA mismatch repair endonuclease MutL [Lacticaseibacillus casei]QXG58948.1 DNA mismatch repair endonuclease MutL [Lacticaseibacillus casei]WFB39607.1 DNA mismatch repair endonuclease MutL [Lacticaseibacillus huelsenbergensis]WFB41308.1 DNA mismatch repair endonuclease MutL [Lacticaseibacillus huelsenbergensis]
MPKIHQLSATLSNQIAAGEVIERPASVVKELVENSIDAQATQIDVKVSAAGLQKIQVSDNGIGIDPADVATAFLRHATSKILTTRDLFNVHSLGFRGEALASIAAVADVTLTTATDSGIGAKIHVKGGKVEDQTTAAHRRGTDVEVSDLFFNTPARLKYMKSQQTELGKIVDIVSRLALANPGIAFTVSHDGNMVVRTAGQGDLRQTLAGIYGLPVARSMVDFQAQDLDFQVSGLTSLPETTRASRNYLSLVVNGRYIKNFQLTKAVIAGYGSKLMVGRYPMGVITIQMDAALVDVNVHPTKAEVRLSKEDQLSHLLSEAIRSRLAKENLIPDALDNLPKREHYDLDQLELTLNKISPKTAAPTPPQGTELHEETHDQPVNTPQAASTPSAETAPDLTMDDLDDRPIFSEPQRLAAWDQRYQQLDANVAPALVEDLPAQDLKRNEPAERFPDLTYLAQVHGTYLLAESSDGLYILDQHAAQERVNYEFYRQEIGKVSTDQQHLLVPIVLDYSAADAIDIRTHRDVLESVGLYLEDFGQNSFVVEHHPTWFKAGQEEDTIKEMVDWVLRDGKITVAAFREKTAIMMSCKRAIKANHHLDDKQARALIQKLPQCENPFNCPHGRPVLVHFSNTDLEKMFKRIQDSHESGEMQA